MVAPAMDEDCVAPSLKEKYRRYFNFYGNMPMIIPVEKENL